ncbi:MAG: type I-C CRISPR-associated protein Cas8c/Csd1 [Desulfuromonas sp. SDB]|nr:MAG: type I-C CRISPR-associated protein Cas8c/Csd1 [Desulfuromonas sp. SDB]
MIIQSLCKYYDILNKDGKVSGPGYSSANVSFSIVIDDEGNLKNIIDLRTGDKKPRPKTMNVPLHKSRSGKNPPPYFLCDNAKYVFGVEEVNKSKFKNDYKSSNKNTFTVLEETEKDVILVDESTQARFNSFRELHLSILKNIDDRSAVAFVKFIQKYSPEKFLDNPKIVQYKDQILDNASFVFYHDGSYLHEKSSIRRAWEDYQNNSMDRSDCLSQCLISGNKEPIARTHQLIKGVANAQSAGASLVGFNDKSFNSYGKTQSYNAPIGKYAMFKYTTALNYLLSNPKHRLSIGDSTVIFWADAPEGMYEDFTKYFINPVENKGDKKSNDGNSEKRITDNDLLVLVKDVLDIVRKGQDIRDVDLGIDPKKMFHILGLSPNNARLSVRFWYMNEFGDFVEKVSQHYFDMEIEKDNFAPPFISTYKLVNETVPKPQPSERPKPNPILSGLLMRSIINNTPYPVQMYNAILSRVKVERTINSVRAGFIKAYLFRLARTGSAYVKEDMITMSLNETSQDVPYRLGRLFAVLEKAQTDTSKSIGSTINSKYFSSASTTPAVVFPVLIKLAQHHIAKSDYGVRITKDIEDVLSGVDKFPPYLNLEEQGMFMLGYYHQKKANYQKKEEAKPAKEA